MRRAHKSTLDQETIPTDENECKITINKCDKSMNTSRKTGADIEQQ